MQSIGSIVSSLAYNNKLHKDAAAVLIEAKRQAEFDLERLGVLTNQSHGLIGQAETRMLAMVHLCESPIEQMMLAALSMMVVPGTDCFPPAIHDVMSGDAWPDKPVVIVPQFVVARYRLDFLVTVKAASGRTMMAIECDGAQHHDGPVNRKRDTARDEYLENVGIYTLRYKGGWIYKNGWKIADEIAAIIQMKMAA